MTCYRCQVKAKQDKTQATHAGNAQLVWFVGHCLIESMYISNNQGS
mgnify:CR=1 FL=1